MMKLLLIQPPIQDFYDTEIRHQPLGLAYLKAAVRRFLPEVEVVIRDFHHGWGRRTIPLPKELSYLKEYYAYPDKSPFSTFHQYYHFGADFETITQEVEKQKPDLVGISSLFSPYYREVLTTAKAIKERMDIPILVGGHHVTALPERMLREPSVDFVVYGEGERPLVEFLREWMDEKQWDCVSNLGFKRNEELIFNPKRDNYSVQELPIPDFSDFSSDSYLFEKRPLSFVITSRGCPHNCDFCSVRLTFGNRYRRRSVEDILQEVVKRYEEGIRVFDFEDDNLTFDREAMIIFCQRLMELFPKKDVQFLAMNGISYPSLDEELLSLMREAGFTHLNLSLVSSNYSVRKESNRPHTLERYLDIVNGASKLGFHIVSYQILGLPGESLESMIQAIILNAELPVLLGASMFYRTPGTPIAERLGEMDDQDILRSRLTAMATKNDDCTQEDLFTLFVMIRIINFLKGISFCLPKISLSDALEIAASQSERFRWGVLVLEKMLTEQSFFAYTLQGFQPYTKFNEGLFLEIWSRLKVIRTLERCLIRIEI